MRKILPVFAALLFAACSSQPKTDAELAGAAQRAVNSKLDAQGTFSLMESVVSQNIACGHVLASNVPGRGTADQDFVYRNNRLIMDDDPDFDGAAIACDLAAGARNSEDANNNSGN